MDRLKEIKDKITFDRRIAVNTLNNEAVDWLITEIERLRKVGQEMLDDLRSNTISATDFIRVAQHERWQRAFKGE